MGGKVFLQLLKQNSCINTNIPSNWRIYKRKWQQCFTVRISRDKNDLEDRSRSRNTHWDWESRGLWKLRGRFVDHNWFMGTAASNDSHSNSSNTVHLISLNLVFVLKNPRYYQIRGSRYQRNAPAYVKQERSVLLLPRLHLSKSNPAKDTI